MKYELEKGKNVVLLSLFSDKRMRMWWHVGVVGIKSCLWAQRWITISSSVREPACTSALVTIFYCWFRYGVYFFFTVFFSLNIQFLRNLCKNMASSSWICSRTSIDETMVQFSFFFLFFLNSYLALFNFMFSQLSCSRVWGITQRAVLGEWWSVIRVSW